jgi:hypothetical protein
MLFVGHSEAGKSTITNILLAAGAGARAEAESSRGSSASVGPTVEILCDDRNIVRRTDEGLRIYGTWSHGDVPVVSSASAPLRAILFLEKAAENTLTPLTDRREVARRLLACLIKPFVTAEWWSKTLDLVGRMAPEIPAYLMRFDKSGEIVAKLGRLTKLPRGEEKIDEP